MEKSSFFNSVNGDRKYNAKDFADYFNSFIGNGVFGSNNLQLLANDNMTITLKTGKAWINGYIYLNTDDLIKAIEPADGVLNRIDRLVLRLDYVNREIKAYIKKGTFASSPVAPTLQRDADMYELGLADIYLAKGATSIAQANITDTRANSELCGWVNTLISGNIDALINDIDSLENSLQTLSTQKLDKTAINDSVTSTSSTTVASSKAVKTAYDRGNHAHPYAPSSHVGAGGTAHAVVTTSANGFMSAADKSKLNGIEAGATGDMTATEMLAALKTVDTDTSGLNANFLQGKTASDFQSNSKVYGKIAYDETKLSTETVTKLIPIGSGKSNAVIYMRNDNPDYTESGLIFCAQDKTKSYAISNYRRDNYFYHAQYDPVILEFGISPSGGLKVNESHISGSNLRIVFTFYKTLQVSLAWEAW